MNLSFARTAYPETLFSPLYDLPSGSSGSNGKAPLPAGLAGAIPFTNPIDKGFDELPVPKLVDPPVFSVNKDGSINMASISMPPVLADLLGLRGDHDEDMDCAQEQSEERSPDPSSRDVGDVGSGSVEELIQGNGVGNPALGERNGRDECAKGSRGDPPRPTEKVHEWGNVDKVWPQPPPGIRGLMATGPNTNTNTNSATKTPALLNTMATPPLILGRPGARLPAALPWSGGCATSSVVATTPPVPYVGQRLRSPTSAAAAAAGASRGLSEVFFVILFVYLMGVGGHVFLCVINVNLVFVVFVLLGE